MESTHSPRPHATLRILLPSGGVVSREIEPDDIQIGKGPHNHVVISDPAVSTSHALIRFEGQAYTLTDLGSHNGTRVNGKQISEPHKLKHGDVIVMGQSRVTFRLADHSETADLQVSNIKAARRHVVPSPTEESIANAIVADELVPKSEIERVRGADAKGRSLYKAVVDERLASEVDLRDLMSRTFNIPTITLGNAEVKKKVWSKFPAQLAVRTQTVPITIEAERLTLAVADPTAEKVIAEVSRIMKLPIELRLATPSEIGQQIDQHYGPKLSGVLPSGQSVAYAVSNDPMDIGKAANNHIVVSDASVSNKHARLTAGAGGYSIVDVGSSNGTYVNGKKQGDKACALRSGDTVQLGKVVLTFTNPVETIGGATEMVSKKDLEKVRKRAQASAAGDIAGDAEGAKKKGQNDRLKAAFIGAVSRIVAQVIAAVVTIMVALYLANKSLSPKVTPGPTPAVLPATQPSEGKDPQLNERIPTDG